MKFKKITTVLIDLDGTLGYFTKGDLTEYLAKLYATKLAQEFNKPLNYVLGIIFKAVSEVKRNPPINRTIAYAMLEIIADGLNTTVNALNSVTDKFYAIEFDELKQFYKPVDGAKDIINYFFSKRFKVAIATEPLVKRVGVVKRLAWIGLDSYPYCFIANAEECRAPKPHKTYFLDILEKCDSKPEESVMIGDKLENDIFPARELGMMTIYINKMAETEDVANISVNSLTELLKIIEIIIK